MSSRAREVRGNNRIVKISLVGVGMRSHAGIASRMFEILAKESINILMISTSEIKISVLVDEKYLGAWGTGVARRLRFKVGTLTGLMGQTGHRMLSSLTMRMKICQYPPYRGLALL